MLSAPLSLRLISAAFVWLAGLAFVLACGSPRAQGLEAGGRDLLDLVRQFESAARAPGAADATETAGRGAVMVFVSFSIPKPILQELARQTAAARGVMVLRGFVRDTDARATQEQAALVNQDADAAWQIDPQAFRSFGIDRVPAYVVASPGNEASGCKEESACRAGGGQWATVFGDVSLVHALEHIARTAISPAIVAQATLALERMRKAPR